MRLLRYAAYFLTGGSSYVAMELLWRGRSHISMFLAGGTAFLLLGRLDRMLSGAPRILKAVTGAGVITAVELCAGLLFNRQYRVWDYRSMPLNLMGQICLPFSLLWIPVSLAAMAAYRLLDKLSRRLR